MTPWSSVRNVSVGPFLTPVICVYRTSKENESNATGNGGHDSERLPSKFGNHLVDSDEQFVRVL